MTPKAQAAIRELAYAIVKKAKAAYTADGCDWQRAIEESLTHAIEEGPFEYSDPDEYGMKCASCGKWETVMQLCAECELATTNEPPTPEVDKKLRALCATFGVG